MARCICKQIRLENKESSPFWTTFGIAKLQKLVEKEYFFRKNLVFVEKKQ